MNPITAFRESRNTASYDPTVDLYEPIYVSAGFKNEEGSFTGFGWFNVHDHNGNKNTWFKETWRFNYEDDEYHKKYPHCNEDVHYCVIFRPGEDKLKISVFKPKGGHGVCLIKDVELPPDVMIECDDEERPVYIGGCKNGKRHGLGSEFRYTRGEVPEEVQGWWDSGILLYVRDGDVLIPAGGPETGEPQYDGEVNAEGLPHGEGRMVYPNGGVYEGSWENGKRSGEGTLLRKGYSHYTGEWKDDKRNGQGEGCIDGGKYKGEWLADQRHGKGTWSSGYVIECQWDHDRPYGKATVGDTRNYYDQKWYQVTIPENAAMGNAFLKLIELLISKADYHTYTTSKMMTIELLSCTVKGYYRGSIDSKERPDGEGSFSGRDSDNNSCEYAGIWKKGQPDGKGVLKRSKVYGEESIDGTWKNGSPDGVCQCEFYENGKQVQKRVVYRKGEVILETELNEE